MTKRFGFTLAEVLTTLGIIGVVAAMTIPTLISNTSGAQFKSAYKKALSTLNQAVLMNIAMEDTDFSTIVADDADAGVKMSDIITERLQSATLDDDYFTPGQNVTVPLTAVIDIGYDVDCVAGEGGSYAPPQGVTGTCDTTTHKVHVAKYTSTTDTAYKVYNLADGTTFIYNVNAHDCTDEDALYNNCYGFIDVNSGTNPNTVIACDQGTGTGTTAACKVDNSNVKDIYPVIFHGQTVEPATDAARYVLFGK